MRNAGWHFYRKYYATFDFSNLLPANRTRMEELQKDWKKHPDHAPFYRVNETIKNLNLQGNITSYFPTAGTDAPKLSTTYPGLLIGTGYSHGSGVMGEYKIGFFFDHTTGLPIIPGSSIKGMLRSAFPMKYWEKAKEFLKKAKREDEKKQEYQQQAKIWQAEGDVRLEFMHDLISKLNNKITKDDIQKIELEIFEGCYAVDKHGDKLYLPLCQRDVFYDAYPVESPGGALFADDFITPHSKDGIPQPLKNPIPIQFLKVAPNVIFQFSFSLPETYRVFDEDDRQGKDHGRLLSSTERQVLFIKIIETLGLGAKTNVGYGQMNEVRISETTTVENTPIVSSADLPPDQYYAKVLEGKVNRSGADGEFPRLQLFPKKSEQIQPYRVKDGSLGPEDVGKILVVIPTFDERNKEQIIAFQIVNQNKS
jgi:CRISPR-associated protein Cmr6